VFELIREHNLFTAVQDQALLLVEFDHELMNKEKSADLNERGIAITLLVDHIHSIPVRYFIVFVIIYTHPVLRYQELCSSYAVARVSFSCTSMHYLKKTPI
jgi:hypothetical protein